MNPGETSGNRPDESNVFIGLPIVVSLCLVRLLVERSTARVKRHRSPSQQDRNFVSLSFALDRLLEHRVQSGTKALYFKFSQFVVSIS
jgi:hypothetical protein